MDFVNIPLVITRPRVARAGTNKLKCQKNLPTGSHLSKNLRRVSNFEATLSPYNSGKYGTNEKLFVSTNKRTKRAFRGKKKFLDFDLF